MFSETSTWFTLAAIYAGVILVAFWGAMIVWAYRDMRARSRDVLAQIFVGALVGFLTLPGLLIYLFLRPRETLSEAYERSLEEEALLQEIEEKQTCPGCSRQVEGHWQICPSCHTRLKKACISCNERLELSWKICPNCGAEQSGAGFVGQMDFQQPLSLNNTTESNPPVIRRRTRTDNTPLEFVDGDNY